MDGTALAKAAQLWSLLDEMAENEPQAYRRLLQQQRAEAERFCAPPEPHLCLRARPADVVEQPLFINVCGWKRVPAPQAPTDPTPVSAGPLEEVSGGGDLYRVIDIAYNPAVLQRGEESPAKLEHLIHLTLQFVEERCSLPLSHLYTIEPYTLKGSLETMQQRLKGRQLPTPHLRQKTRELTLDRLLQPLEAEECSPAPVLLKEEKGRESEGQLIEEIGADTPAGLRAPVYEMITLKDADETPLQIELNIQLPKDDIMIEVPEKYKLQVALPELVDEERTTAVFHRGKQVLFITVPVAKPAP